LSIGPLVWLGRLGYPVYLIHWPLVVFLRPNGAWVVGWPVIIIRFAVAVALAWLLFRYVERPLRNSPLIAGFKGAATWAGLAGTALLAATVVAGWR